MKQSAVILVNKKKNNLHIQRIRESGYANPQRNAKISNTSERGELFFCYEQAEIVVLYFRIE